MSRMGHLSHTSCMTCDMSRVSGMSCDMSRMGHLSHGWHDCDMSRERELQMSHVSAATWIV